MPAEDFNKTDRKVISSLYERKHNSSYYEFCTTQNITFLQTLEIRFISKYIDIIRSSLEFLDWHFYHVENIILICEFIEQNILLGFPYI